MNTIEAEFTENQSTEMVPVPRAQSAAWTPSFAVSVDEAIERKRQKTRFFREVMEEGKHYGVIPGTGTKPTLLKPGAEMLLANMGLQAEFSNELEPVLDYTGEHYGGEAFIKYNRRCTIYRQTGPTRDDRMIIACAGGSCSSWEEKYRYRNAERICPKCGKGAIIKGKAEYGGGFVCFKKKDGCGATFRDNDQAITKQENGKVANPNIADLDNTILKIADKRALVAATLIATGCSDIFTQDIEDIPQRPTQPQRQASATKSPVDDHTEQLRYAVSSYRACYPTSSDDAIRKGVKEAIKGHFDFQTLPTKWADVNAVQLKWAGDYFASVKAEREAEGAVAA